MSKQSQRVWAGRYAYNTLDISKDIDPTPYAGELFTVLSYEVPKSWSYHILTIRHDDGLEFPIHVYPEQRAIMVAAGHTLPSATGKHAFTATITYKMVNDGWGSIVPQLTTCEAKPCTAIVPYGMYTPYVLVEQSQAIRKPVILDYPLDGETVSIHTITYHPRGHRKHWLAKGKFEKHDTPPIHIYPEHARAFKVAGLPALVEDFNRPQTYMVDVVLEWSDIYNGYRPIGVYGHDGTLHEIEKPTHERKDKPELRPDIEDSIKTWPSRWKYLAKSWRPKDIVEGFEWFPPVAGELQSSLNKRPKFVYYNDTEGLARIERRESIAHLCKPANNENESESAA